VPPTLACLRDRRPLVVAFLDEAQRGVQPLREVFLSAATIVLDEKQPQTPALSPAVSVSLGVPVMPVTAHLLPACRFSSLARLGDSTRLILKSTRSSARAGNRTIALLWKVSAPLQKEMRRLPRWDGYCDGVLAAEDVFLSAHVWLKGLERPVSSFACQRPARPEPTAANTS